LLSIERDIYVANETTVFRTLHHVCIVVSDIQAALAFYESVGIGPWVDYPSLTQYTQLEVPNVESFLATTYKYANLENIQIQLCQPGNGASPQRQFLETHGEGVFHLGFSVPDCDAAESTAQSLGIEVLMKGRRNDGTGFSYFDTANRGAAVTLEVRSSSKS
jgi:catechol 2,3-dioxygenase-like lactoylglutathione lyase family enzyme